MDSRKLIFRQLSSSYPFPRIVFRDNDYVSLQFISPVDVCLCAGSTEFIPYGLTVNFVDLSLVEYHFETTGWLTGSMDIIPKYKRGKTEISEYSMEIKLKNNTDKKIFYSQGKSLGTLYYKNCNISEVVFCKCRLKE